MSYLFSPRSGSGATIEVSLAFRNEVGDEEKSEENLYLKGNGKAYGKQVDLYEKVDTSESRGVRDQYLWSLQVFKNSGTVRLMSVDQGGGTTHTSLELTCTGNKFEVSEEKYKEQWDLGKPVTSITFTLGDDCVDRGGKEICDIKIAERDNLKNLFISNEKTKIENPKNDLYLKGINRSAGQTIDFHETVDSGDGKPKQGRWQLSLYESGNTRFDEVGLGGGHIDLPKEINCEPWKNGNLQPEGKNGWDLGQPVTKITFKVKESCEERSGKRVCDIEIAEGVGLKERNFSAFRNEEGGKEGSEKDLYLKGFDNKTGTVVDFDEDITGEHHIASSSGRRGDKLWQLKIYKESGTHELHSLSGAEGGHYDYDGLTCTGGKFEVSDWTYDENWEKSVSEISFELIGCDETLKGRICDIKIS